MADNNAPIVIRKVIEEGGHGHHGGAWKVAYADFVTAMMAFFLMLWLLSTADQQQLKGLAEYFSDADENKSQPGGMGGILGGVSITADDMAISLPISPFAPTSLPLSSTPQELDPEAFTLDLAAEYAEAHGGEVDIQFGDEAFEAERERREQEAFETAKTEILNAISQEPALNELAESLIIDSTPEGLRIQMLDQEQTAMFPTGSSELYPSTRQLMEVVAKSIANLPNKLSIRGHTDSVPFAQGSGNDNWRLSSDRANATRLALTDAGIDPSRIANVIGKADSEPLLPDDPTNPRNRRISVVMLKQAPAAPPAIGATSSITAPGDTAP